MTNRFWRCGTRTASADAASSSKRCIPKLLFTSIHLYRRGVRVSVRVPEGFWRCGTRWGVGVPNATRRDGLVHNQASCVRIQVGLIWCQPCACACAGWWRCQPLQWQHRVVQRTCRNSQPLMFTKALSLGSRKKHTAVVSCRVGQQQVQGGGAAAGAHQ